MTGKASVRWGRNRHIHPSRSAGVLGTARWKGDAGYWGRPVADEGSGLDVAVERRLGRGSDRAVGALMPGNSGGAKGPDLWCACEEGEGRCIGVSLEHTEEIRNLQIKLYRGAKAK
jgi:hypothetical protein